MFLSFGEKRGNTWIVLPVNDESLTSTNHQIKMWKNCKIFLIKVL